MNDDEKSTETKDNNDEKFTPFKKPSARKSFAPLLNALAHPLKAIIFSKSSPLLVVFSLLKVFQLCFLEVSNSFAKRGARGPKC